MAMTPATYRTLREACGLSQQAAAEFHNVALRTILHWETGRNSVPAGAAAEMALLNGQIERATAEAIKLWSEKSAGAESVMLIRYRTPTDYAGSRPEREGLSWACHNALIARSMLALERAGARVVVQYSVTPPGAAASPAGSRVPRPDQGRPSSGA